MITQKPVFVKLDSNQLERLDDLCRSLGCNRNKMINFAVKMVVDNLTSESFRNSLLTSVYQTAISSI